MNYGSSGAGTTVHLSGELFSVMTGIKMVHVPYKGATEALTGLLAGQTDLMFASLSSSIPLIKSGKLKAFGVTGAQRSPSIPELPTVAEAANLPGFAAAAWFAIVAPAGLDQAHGRDPQQGDARRARHAGGERAGSSPRESRSAPARRKNSPA